jgi:cellobiose-specific phosphotransferase system component IIB
MEEAARAQGLAVEVACAGVAELPEALSGTAVVLVGPQVRHRWPGVQDACAHAGVPAGLIEGRVYGLVDGRGALAQALTLAGAG